MSKDEVPEFIRVSEAARLLSVSRWTIIRWLESGKLTPYRVDLYSHYRLRRTDVMAMMKPHKSLTTSE